MEIKKNKLFVKIIRGILFFIAIVMAAYISLASYLIINVNEEAKIIERKFQYNFVYKLKNQTKDQPYTKNYYVELGKKIINELNSNNKSIALTAEQEQVIREICYTYWYYRTDNSAVKPLTNFPSLALLFLSVGITGIFGSLSSNLIDAIRMKKSLDESINLLSPFFGFFIGVMILSFSFIVPIIFIKNGSGQLNYPTVILMSFFAGLYSEYSYQRITSFFKIIGIKTE